MSLFYAPKADKMDFLSVPPCPASNPYVYDSGARCCQTQLDANNSPLTYTSTNCYQGQEMTCPLQSCSNGGKSKSKWPGIRIRSTVMITLQPVWPEKNHQISIKVAQNDFHRKRTDFDTFTKLPKNVGDLGKLIVALKTWPKSNKLPNLVTLLATESNQGY